MITRNRAMTALKEQLAYPARDRSDLLDTKFAGEESLSLEVKELRETLERAVNTLPPGGRKSSC